MPESFPNSVKDIYKFKKLSKLNQDPKKTIVRPITANLGKTKDNKKKFLNQPEKNDTLYTGEQNINNC